VPVNFVVGKVQRGEKKIEVFVRHVSYIPAVDRELGAEASTSCPAASWLFPVVYRSWIAVHTSPSLSLVFFSFGGG
jgi:hypothetical protein